MPVFNQNCNIYRYPMVPAHFPVLSGDEKIISAHTYLSSALLSDFTCLPAPILLSYARTSSIRNDRVALLVLARLLLKGQFVYQDEMRAVRLLLRASRPPKPLPEAVELLADCYESGVGVNRNVVHANYLRSNIFPNFLFNLAEEPGSNLKTIGMEENSTDSHIILKDALSKIGEKINAGKLAERCDERAVCTIIEAANSTVPNPEVIFCLARMHQTGFGVRLDYRKAANMMLKLKVSGHMEALIQVAEYYLSGIGVHQSKKKAIMLYQMAARRGNATAVERLGDIRALGAQGAHNLEAGMKHPGKPGKRNWEMSTEKSKCIANSDERLIIREISQKQSSAEEKYAAKFFNLAYKYEEGMGVRKDAAKARTLYERAITGNCVEGMVNLGVMCETGSGGEIDLSRAHMLYMDALGFSEGDMNLGTLSSVKIEILCTAGNNLARMYWLGSGVEKNTVLALSIWGKVSEFQGSLSESVSCHPPMKSMGVFITAFEAEKVGPRRCQIIENA